MFLECPAACRTLFAVGESVALRAQSRVCCHGAMVGEATLALDACFAISAARVVSCIQLSPGMSEFRGRFVSCASGASVWPRLRRAVVASEAARWTLAQLADLPSFVTNAASAKEIPRL